VKAKEEKPQCMLIAIEDPGLKAKEEK